MEREWAAISYTDYADWHGWHGWSYTDYGDYIATDYTDYTDGKKPVVCCPKNLSQSAKSVQSVAEFLRAIRRWICPCNPVPGLPVSH